MTVNGLALVRLDYRKELMKGYEYLKKGNGLIFLVAFPLFCLCVLFVLRMLICAWSFI